MAITPGKLQTQSSAHALVIRPDTTPAKYLSRLLIYTVIALAGIHSREAREPEAGRLHLRIGKTLRHRHPFPQKVGLDNGRLDKRVAGSVIETEVARNLRQVLAHMQHECEAG